MIGTWMLFYTPNIVYNIWTEFQNDMETRFQQIEQTIKHT